MQNNFSTKARCRSAAYKAASSSSSGVLQSLQVLRDFWKEEGVSPIDNRGDTILHFLAVNGNVAGFEILEPNLSVQDLETRNNSGDTPLHEAARFGNVEMCDVDLVMLKCVTVSFKSLNCQREHFYLLSYTC